jgi:hypothetical protein
VSLPCLVGNANIVVQPEATAVATNVWVQSVELRKRNVELRSDLSAVVTGRDLVPLLAALVDVRLGRRGDVASWLRGSRSDGLCRCSLDADANVVTKPERLAVATNPWVPVDRVRPTKRRRCDERTYHL